MVKIQKVTKKDFSDWLSMGWLFWKAHPKEKIKKEFQGILASKKEAAFIARNEFGEALGFVNVAIRSDYVEGSKKSPVGYIEGIYVEKKHRNKGIAKKLVKGAEKWFRGKGLSEMGSDAEIDNILSQKLHKATGFKKGETIVHYIKKIR